MKTIKTATISSLFLVVAGLAPAAHSQEYVRNLRVSCGGQIEILSTSHAHYSPYQPGHGRVNPIPASAGVTAQVAVTPGPGCDVLTTKYGIDLQHLQVTVGLNQAVDLGTTQAHGQALVGKKVYFTVKQYFPLAYQGKLPFFPLAHQEYLVMEADLGTAKVGQSLNFDVEQVYGTLPPDQVKDADVLKLMDLGLAFFKDLALSNGPGEHGSAADFFDSQIGNVLVELEPKSPQAQVEYAHKLAEIGEIFVQYDPYSNFFDFHVGGSSGTKFGEKLSAMTQKGAFSEAELAQLLLKFPAALLVGFGPYPNFPQTTCFATTEGVLLDYLGQLKAQILQIPATELYRYFSDQHDPLAVLAGGGSIFCQTAHSAAITPAVKTLAAEVLGLLTTH